MDYALIYGHCYNGAVLTGPKAGQTLTDKRCDDITCLTEAQAFDRAVEHKAKLDGTIRVYVKQWHDHKPDLIPANCEWISQPRRRGGFLLTWLS